MAPPHVIRNVAQNTIRFSGKISGWD